MKTFSIYDTKSYKIPVYCDFAAPKFDVNSWETPCFYRLRQRRKTDELKEQSKNYKNIKVDEKKVEK